MPRGIVLANFSKTGYSPFGLDIRGGPHAAVLEWLQARGTELIVLRIRWSDIQLGENAFNIAAIHDIGALALQFRGRFRTVFSFAIEGEHPDFWPPACNSTFARGGALRETSALFSGGRAFVSTINQVLTRAQTDTPLLPWAVEIGQGLSHPLIESGRIRVDAAAVRAVQGDILQFFEEAAAEIALPPEAWIASYPPEVAEDAALPLGNWLRGVRVRPMATGEDAEGAFFFVELPMASATLTRLASAQYVVFEAPGQPLPFAAVEGDTGRVLPTANYSPGLLGRSQPRPRRPALKGLERTGGLAFVWILFGLAYALYAALSGAHPYLWLAAFTFANVAVSGAIFVVHGFEAHAGWKGAAVFVLMLLDLAAIITAALFGLTRAATLFSTLSFCWAAFGIAAPMYSIYSV